MLGPFGRTKLRRRVGLTAIAAGVFASQVLAADTVYKAIGPDGSVIYSDKPPVVGSADKLEFHNLPASPLPESVLKFRAQIEKTLKARMESLQPPRGMEVRLFTAKWCPHCRRAKSYMRQRGIVFTEYDIETPDGMAAFVQVSESGKSVPLLVTSSGRLLGYSEMGYDRLLQGTTSSAIGR